MNKEIEEQLEKQFPKGDKARGKALVLHAIAQIELEKAVQTERKRCIKKLEPLDKEYSCGCYVIAIEAIRNEN